MKILFIANPAAGLYKEIEEEMIRAGHDVTTIMDRLFKYDPASKVGISFPVLKKYLWKKQVTAYWSEQFDKNEAFNKSYDVLFILSGYSVDKVFVDRLKSLNPQLKVILYTWDGCNYYNFERHFPYVDKCYTFDILDSKKSNRWELLPIYYKKRDFSNNSINKYDLFAFGANHDGRYSFIKKILPQIKGLNYYIKLVSGTLTFGIKEKAYSLLVGISKYKQIKEEVAFSRGEENDDLLLRDGVAAEVYMSLMMASKVILDDQREGQSGLTARFMWALGAGKRIITTNKWALDYPFVNSKQVSIISKDAPKIPMDFIINDLSIDDYSPIDRYEIKNWVSFVLS